MNNPTDPAADAIAALTVVARGTKTRGVGENATTEPADFAGALAGVVTAVAANLGGDVATLLAGRAGSWEADLVRRLVEGTAGPEPEGLAPYRTEPFQIDVDEALADLGVFTLYDDILDRVTHDADEAEFAAFQRHADHPAVAAMQAAIDAGERPDPARLHWPEDHPRHESQEAHERRWERWGPIYDAAAAAVVDDAALVEAQARRDRVLQQIEDAEAEYRRALLASAIQEAQRRGYTAPVIATPPVHERARRAAPAPWWPFDETAEELRQVALRRTPLPLVGQAPDDLPEGVYSAAARQAMVEAIAAATGVQGAA